MDKQKILKANKAGLSHQDGSEYWSYYTPVLQVAYDCGQKGIDFAELPDVTGYRYGNCPETHISFNYADDTSERGLALAAITGEKEIGSSMFFWGREKVAVAGLLLPYTGSDGEHLILSYGAPDWD